MYVHLFGRPPLSNCSTHELNALPLLLTSLPLCPAWSFKRMPTLPITIIMNVATQGYEKNEYISPRLKGAIDEQQADARIKKVVPSLK